MATTTADDLERIIRVVTMGLVPVLREMGIGMRQETTTAAGATMNTKDGASKGNEGQPSKKKKKKKDHKDNQTGTTATTTKAATASRMAPATRTHAEAAKTQAATAWTTVQPRRPKETTIELRKEDWTAPVVEYANLNQQLNKDDKATSYVVLYREEAEVSVAEELVKWRDKYAYCKCDQTRMRTRQSRASSMDRTGATTGATAPRLLERQPNRATIRVQDTKSMALRLEVDKRSAENDMCNAASKNPTRTFSAWVRARGIAASVIIDIWGYREEDTNAGRGVTTLVRDATKDIETMIRQSGVEGCFVEPLSWPTELPRMFPTWCKNVDEQKHSDELAAALATKPPWGLIRGSKQLGTHGALKEGSVVQQTFELKTPREWRRPGRRTNPAHDQVGHRYGPRNDHV